MCDKQNTINKTKDNRNHFLFYLRSKMRQTKTKILQATVKQCFETKQKVLQTNIVVFQTTKYVRLLTFTGNVSF